MRRNKRKVLGNYCFMRWLFFHMSSVSILTLFPLASAFDLRLLIHTSASILRVPPLRLGCGEGVLSLLGVVLHASLGN
jgi:hypothetical protein